MPFDIPDNWTWVRLKNLVTIQTGKKDANFGSIDGAYDFFTCALTPIKCKTYSYDGEYILLPGNGANVGQSVHYFGKFEAYQRTYLINKIYDQFSFYYLKLVLDCSWKKWNDDKLFGSAIPYIKLPNLEEFLVPLAPLSEEIRIHNKMLDIYPLLKSYEMVEEKLSTLESEFPEKLKKSILQYAIEGKLVKQDPNDEPASVLLERIKAEKERLIKEGKIKRDKNESYIYQGDDKNYYEKIGKNVSLINMPFFVPSSWNWIKTRGILKNIQYGFNGSGLPEGKVKMLRITDIQNNSVNWETLPYCSISEDAVSDYQISTNDIFIARTGGTIGKSFQLKEDKQNTVFAGYLIRFQFIDEKLSNYVSMFLNSPLYWNQVADKQAGTGQPNINGVSLGNLLIPIPPINEQVRIESKINKIFEIISC